MEHTHTLSHNALNHTHSPAATKSRPSTDAPSGGDAPAGGSG